MPPKRCPECGRFLANDLVASLFEAPAPCPRCGVALHPDTIVGGERDRAPRPAVLAASSQASDSVRPPDLDPATVRARDDDPLAGWDAGATPEEVASWRADARPFPTDSVVVVSAAVVGGVLGAVLPERPRGSCIALGAVTGTLGAGIARRIWMLRG
ncbi:MAG: hypothetical protein ACLFS9_06365 [Nitriliruptoraceae bacterium]